MMVGMMMVSMRVMRWLEGISNFLDLEVILKSPPKNKSSVKGRLYPRLHPACRPGRETRVRAEQDLT
jgi:hypothetical protein